MNDPMRVYLDKLCDEADELAEQNRAMPVQLVFTPGMTMQAGALRRGPTPGLFELAYPASPGPNPLPGHEGADQIMISDVFSASAVLRVVKPLEGSHIDVARPKIVVPGN